MNRLLSDSNINVIKSGARSFILNTEVTVNLHVNNNFTKLLTMTKRSIDLVVVSDLHLGTYACRAAEFIAYLRSIEPQMLILNGDIVDAWQFSKHYFPPSHIAVIQEILQMMSNGTRVVYITGNHDETLRRYSDLNVGNFQLTDKILIEVDGKTTWIFHGDVFDRTTRKQAKFWSKLGSNGYALLLGFNRKLNKLMQRFGYEKLSLSKKLMHQFHKRIVRVDEFETMIGELAIEKKYDYVICGHIHEPKKRVISNESGSVCYLNSGDWVEHSTALEYYDNTWQLFNFESAAIKTDKKKVSKIQPQVIAEDIAIFLHSLQPSSKAI